MRPPSPRRPGGKRERPAAPSRAETPTPDTDEASPASSEQARSSRGEGSSRRRGASKREASERFAQRRSRQRGEEPSEASAERGSRGRGDESSSALERRRTRGTVATPVGTADAATLLGSVEATDLGDRLRERTRARRMLLLRRIGLSVVTVVVVTAVGWVAFFSPLFALSSANVQVTGQDGRLVTVESVRSSVSSFEGVPLTRLNTAAVAHAVLSNVAVKTVTVSRRWPTGLKVSVTMRTGMVVEAAEGAYWLVDDQGERFEQVGGVGGYPLVTLPEDRARGASDVASVLGALDESTRSQVSAITSIGNQVTFTLRGGQTVKWGTSEDAPQKARVLATLLANVKATTYDVSAPNHPVTS